MVLTARSIPFIKHTACSWGVKAEICRSNGHLPGNAGEGGKEGAHEGDPLLQQGIEVRCKTQHE